MYTVSYSSDPDAPRKYKKALTFTVEDKVEAIALAKAIMCASFYIPRQCAVYNDNEKMIYSTAEDELKT